MNLIWINSAKYLGDYRLSLSFSNGEQRLMRKSLSRLTLCLRHLRTNNCSANSSWTDGQFLGKMVA